MAYRIHSFGQIDNSMNVALNNMEKAFHQSHGYSRHL